jgi:hypothetical protein
VVEHCLVLSLHVFVSLLFNGSGSMPPKAARMRPQGRMVGNGLRPHRHPKAPTRLPQSAHKAWRRTADDGGKAETLKAES